MAELLSIRLTEDSKITAANIDEKASKYGLSRSAFIVKAIELLIGFDSEFLGFAERYARDLGITASMLIERAALCHIAERAADEEFYGQPSPEALIEYAPNPGITARQFFDNEVENRVNQMKLANPDQWAEFHPEGNQG